MIDSSDLFTESEAERKAADAYNAYIRADFSIEHPFSLERLTALEREHQEAVGAERAEARKRHIIRSQLSNEETGPWCDDEFHWHPHAKDERTGRWFDACKHCNPPQN